MLSLVWLFATPWTRAHQAPLSMGFSRQEYWSGLPCPPPGDLPCSGTEPSSPVLQVDSLPSEPLGKLTQLNRVTEIVHHKVMILYQFWFVSVLISSVSVIILYQFCIWINCRVPYATQDILGKGQLKIQRTYEIPWGNNSALPGETSKPMKTECIVKK